MTDNAHPWIYAFHLGSDRDGIYMRNDDLRAIHKQMVALGLLPNPKVEAIGDKADALDYELLQSMEKRIAALEAVRKDDPVSSVLLTRANDAEAEITRLRQSLASEIELRRTASATHRCKVCGARWTQWPDGTWTLQHDTCGKCCDMVAMGEQMEPIGLTAEVARLNALNDKIADEYEKENVELCEALDKLEKLGKGMDKQCKAHQVARDRFKEEIKAARASRASAAQGYRDAIKEIAAERDALNEEVERLSAEWQADVERMCANLAKRTDERDAAIARAELAERAVYSQTYRGNSVSYWYQKAETYGNLVHGIAPKLGAKDDETLVDAADRFVKDTQADLRNALSLLGQCRDRFPIRVGGMMSFTDLIDDLLDKYRKA